MNLKYHFAFGIFVSSVLGWIAFMFADNQPPYSYIPEKSYVIPNPSQAGHQVTVHWELRVNRLCPGFIVRSIVDANTMAVTSYDPTPALGTVKKPAIT